MSDVPLRCKGYHEIVYQTVFGKLTLNSPRLYDCNHGAREEPASPRSLSPLAETQPERSSPELRYVQAKFAALMSYGLTIKVLEDILPLDQTLAAASIRRTLHRTSERIGANGAQRQAAFVAPRDSIPAPSPVRAIGIDGAYLRAHDGKDTAGRLVRSHHR